MMRLKIYALAILGAALSILTFGKVQKNKGAAEERTRQKEIDNENALDVSRRASSVRVRDRDNLEFRD